MRRSIGTAAIVLGLAATGCGLGQETPLGISSFPVTESFFIRHFGQPLTVNEYKK